MRSIDRLTAALTAILLLASLSAYSADHREAPAISTINFLLEVDGVMLGRFANVEGLGAEIEVVEFSGGGEPDRIRKIPGSTNYGDITLKRGYTATDDLWTWQQEVIGDSTVRKSGSIRVLSNNGTEILRFNFFDAWPSKYALGVEAANGNDIAIEVLVLTVDSIELE